MGCDDYVSIAVEDSAANEIGTFSGEIVLDDGEPLEFSCVAEVPSLVSNDVACESGGLVIYGSSVETLQLAITSSSGDFSGTIEPRYERFYPNGEDCGGPCRNANERVVLGP